MMSKFMDFTVLECIIMMALSGMIGLGWLAVFILFLKTMRWVARKLNVDHILAFVNVGSVCMVIFGAVLIVKYSFLR